MQESKNPDALNWILGSSLLLIGVFVTVALVNVRTQADSITTQTNINNVAPTIDVIYASDAAAYAMSDVSPIAITPGTTKNVWVSGTVHDDNGDADLNSIVGRLYRNLSASCDVDGEMDNNTCYRDPDVTAGTDCAFDLQTTGDTDAIFTCRFAVQYFADSGTWTFDATVGDAAATFATATPKTFTLSPILSLSIPTTINYGALAPLAIVPSAQTMTITQYGNVAGTVAVSGTSMACLVAATPSGTIPVSSQSWDLADFASNALGPLQLSGTPAATSLSVALQTNDAVPTSDILYWNISVPTGVAGTCTGTNTITSSAL